MQRRAGDQAAPRAWRRTGALRTPVRSISRVRASASQTTKRTNAAAAGGQRRPAPTAAARTSPGRGCRGRPPAGRARWPAAGRRRRRPCAAAGRAIGARTSWQGEVHGDHGDDRERDVDPEDAAPADDSGQAGAVQRAEHAAQLLGARRPRRGRPAGALGSQRSPTSAMVTGSSAPPARPCSARPATSLAAGRRADRGDQPSRPRTRPGRAGSPARRPHRSESPPSSGMPATYPSR